MFLSCGQRPEELEVARKIAALLEQRGFDVYIAINVQTILEINADIVRELKNSDCYLFVNFCREQISDEPSGRYRGSLFSNQELAIAYALDFKRILVVNQKGVRQEGIARYLGVNTEEFFTFDDCCPVVERVLNLSGWKPDYSRRLRAANLRFSEDVIRYRNLGGRFLIGRFLYIDIVNDRPDIAALVTTARCSEFARAGQIPKPSPIRSPLKATAFPGFSHTIFPKSYEAFDLLCVGTYDKAEANFLAPAASGAIVGSQVINGAPSVFLNTALDSDVIPQLPITPGVWKLHYEFFAIEFPVLSIWIELTLSNWNSYSAKILSQEVI